MGGRTDPSAADAVSRESVTDETLRSLHEELIRLDCRREIADPSMTLNGSAYKILWLLVEHGPRTLRGLAQGLQLEQSTINRQVHAVIARGLAQRSSDSNSPAKVVTATEAGEAAYHHDSDIRTQGLRAIAAVMGQQSTADLAAGLRNLNDAIVLAAKEPQRRHG